MQSRGTSALYLLDDCTLKSEHVLIVCLQDEDFYVDVPELQKNKVEFNRIE